MTLKSVIQPLFVLTLAFFIVSHGQSQEKDKWAVPEKYKTMKNPVKSDASSISLGKELYAKYCKSCHGKEGLGDGPKAATLGSSCGDFTSSRFQSQTDGTIFYQITQGRDKMPAFGKSLPSDDDRWSLVNYMRTLK